MTDLDTDATGTGPFGRAARLYRAAGWHGTLPVGRGPGQKSPPPGGWTGHGKPYPSDADIGAWETGSEAGYNIGLRAAPGTLGLDVDDYADKNGGAHLAELEARFGPLPPTWVSSARPAPSGIRWFQVPTHLDGREINWPGEAAKFIEIIQPGHRYAVVWPSTNPDAGGAPYEWRYQHGSEYGAAVVYPPKPDTLPELPEAWVRGLMLPYDRTEKSELADSQLAAWWEQLRTGQPCPVIHSVCTKAVDSLRAVDGARHETARDALSAVVRAGGEGHRGSRWAVAQIHEAFAAAVGAERAGGEWDRMLSGAVKLAVTGNPNPRQNCPHDAPPPAAGATVPEGFTLPGTVNGEVVTVPGAPTLPDNQSAATVDAFIAEVEALPLEQRDDAVRRIAASLPASGVSEAEQQRARATLTAKSLMSGVLLGAWDEITRAAKRAAKEQAKAARAAQVASAARAEVAARREEGRILPPPHAPIDVARELAESLPAPAKWWRGDFYRWTGTRYVEWRPEAVDNWLYHRTADVYFEGPDDRGPVPWRPNEVRVASVAHALSRGVLYRPSDAEPDDSPAQVACANGVYDVPSGSLLPHTPERFNLQAVPFDYDPHAQASVWAWFLDDVLPKDAQMFLQEWFGYVLSGRTDLEKIANLVGLPRSGKGTIATVLEALIGGENVAAPSMPSLVGTFGEQPLIGKTLAIFSDISWSHRDIVTGVEILKAISGQDARDVNRKNREIWHGRLGVRFMIMGNDMPKFTDASGALAGRMIHVRFAGSVAGREDPTLKPRLLEELPGILNWALEGLRRLTANGRFTEPRSSEELAAEVRRQQSPVQGFLDDCCAFTTEAPPVELDTLYPVYRAWAKNADVGAPFDRERFSRALASAGLKVERKMINGVRARRVHGLAPAAPDWFFLLNPDSRPAAGATVPEGFHAT